MAMDERPTPKEIQALVLQALFKQQCTPGNTYRPIIAVQYVTASGAIKWISLFKLGDLAIRRHIKIRAEANSFESAYRKYFRKRWYLGKQHKHEDKNRLAKYQLVFP